MKKSLAAILVISGLYSTNALSEDIGNGFDLSGNISFTSEYFWRGVDQNSSAPAMQGGLDLAHSSGFYFGIWTSNISNSESSQEVDYYGGYSNSISWLTYDLGMISYQYPGNQSATEFEEAYVGLTAAIGPIEVGAKHYAAASDDKDATEFSVSGELMSVGLSLTMGDYDVTGYGNYTIVSASKELLEAWPIEVALTYTSSDLKGDTTSDDDTFIISVSKSF
jgi:uncharacterized protein (TIGR02001 family)